MDERLRRMGIVISTIGALTIGEYALEDALETYSVISDFEPIVPFNNDRVKYQLGTGLFLLILGSYSWGVGSMRRISNE